MLCDTGTRRGCATWLLIIIFFIEIESKTRVSQICVAGHYIPCRGCNDQPRGSTVQWRSTASSSSITATTSSITATTRAVEVKPGPKSRHQPSQCHMLGRVRLEPVAAATGNDALAGDAGQLLGCELEQADQHLSGTGRGRGTQSSGSRSTPMISPCVARAARVLLGHLGSPLPLPLLRGYYTPS